MSQQNMRKVDGDRVVRHCIASKQGSLKTVHVLSSEQLLMSHELILSHKLRHQWIQVGFHNL